MVFWNSDNRISHTSNISSIYKWDSVLHKPSSAKNLIWQSYFWNIFLCNPQSANWPSHVQFDFEQIPNIRFNFIANCEAIGIFFLFGIFLAFSIDKKHIKLIFSHFFPAEMYQAVFNTQWNEATLKLLLFHG